MNREEKEEFYKLLEEKARREKYRGRIFSYYPDEGPLRRELYPKHLAFFAGGVNKRERLMLAANRCITPWTWIETASGSVPALEVWTSTNASVRSWDGEAECGAQLTGGFFRNIEQAFRVVMDNGEFFDCSRKHQILTSEGWTSFDRIVSLSSGLRCWQKLEDYSANCATDGYLGDQPLQSFLNICRELLPSPGGAQKQSLIFELSDEVVHKLECIHAFPGADRLSTLDDLCRLADLFSLFSGPSCNKPVVSLSDRSQEFRRLSLELGPQLQSNSESDPNQFHAFFHSLLAKNKVFGVANRPEQNDEIILADSLYLDWKFSNSAYEESLHGNQRISIFYPYSHPSLVGGQSIVAIVPLGLQPIIDAHVPQFNNYKAAGVFHHNCGKTEGVGGFEATLHLTGKYPPWWVGRRFDHPIKAWAAGASGKTTRDIIQAKLLGEQGAQGTGLIPEDAIISTTAKGGVPNAVDTLFVRHASGGVSQLIFKSYDQKRKAFEGTEQDVIWLDEEPPLDVYIECLMRTMTNNGMLMLTFTPLLGLSETVMTFLPGGKLDERIETSKLVVMATWDDAPHLSSKDKEELWASIPPFQRDARSKGIPQLGSGAIYPVPESDFVVKDFPIPAHWPRAYGMDVGWNRTAVPWGAVDRESDTLYVVSEHYRGQAEPSLHAEAIKARGSWIPGVIDPAARGRGQDDGHRLMQDYIDLGLDLDVAFNGVESGIYQVWMRLSTGRLKVFSSCQNWLTEFRLYRRDEKGQIVKANDHLMDATRYLVMSGLERARTKPFEDKDKPEFQFVSPDGGGNWMG